MQFGKAQNFKVVVGFDPLKTRTMQGYPVLDIDVDIDLMVHRTYPPDRNGKSNWGICEYTTGQRIDLFVNAKSREIAVVAVLKRIEMLDDGELEKALSEAPKVNGKENASAGSDQVCE